MHRFDSDTVAMDLAAPCDLDPFRIEGRTVVARRTGREAVGSTVAAPLNAQFVASTTVPVLLGVKRVNNWKWEYDLLVHHLISSVSCRQWASIHRSSPGMSRRSPPAK